MAEAVRVKGLDELRRDFRRLSKDLDKELRTELKDAAEPVKDRSQDLAQSRIRNMTPHWSGMRLGVGRGGRVVYMRPSARRRGGSPRPNLADLLLERAMEPALEDRESEVAKRIDDMLGRLGGDYGF